MKSFQTVIKMQGFGRVGGGKTGSMCAWLALQRNSTINLKKDAVGNNNNGK